MHGLVFCQTLLHGLVLEQVPFAKVSGSASRARRALEALPDTFAWSSFRAGSFIDPLGGPLGQIVLALT